MYTAVALEMLPFQYMRYIFEHGACVPDDVRDSRPAMARKMLFTRTMPKVYRYAVDRFKYPRICVPRNISMRALS